MTHAAVAMARRVLGLGPRLARLSVFLLVICIGLQMLLGRVVQAHVDRSLLDLGAGLAQLAPPGEPGRQRVLELNGARFHFETGTRAESVSQVLDQAEASCTAGSGETSLEGRFLRGSDGARGFVGCFSRLTADEAAALGEGVDVSGYRYVYAQPGDESTQVVRFWTEGSIDLGRLFPGSGDAPGIDAPGVPRPPDARRVLSARELGEPQQITLYQTVRAEPAALDAWYRKRLPGLGWHPLEVGRKTAAKGDDRVLMVDRSGSLTALVFSVEEGAGSVAVLSSL